MGNLKQRLKNESENLKGKQELFAKCIHEIKNTDDDRIIIAMAELITRLHNDIRHSSESVSIDKLQLDIIGEELLSKRYGGYFYNSEDDDDDDSF